MKRILTAAFVTVLLSGCITMPSATGAGAQAVDIPAPKEGNLRYTITVSEFKNEAGWHGQWDVGNGFKTIMTDSLQQSGWFVVLGDNEMRDAAMKEQDLADSGRTAKGKKTPKIGYMTPAQLLVRGSITHVQQNKAGGEGGINFKGISIGGSKDSAEINITMYIVDSETGQVKASTKVVGTSKAGGMKFGYHGSALGGLTGNAGGYKKDNVGKACEDAVAQGVVFLIKQLESIPWEGSVVGDTDGEIMMNRGSREGVNVGDIFKVGETKIVKDPDTGETLDVDVKTVGEIKVSRVKEKLSYCSVENGKGKITVGMTVVPSK